MSSAKSKKIEKNEGAMPAKRYSMSGGGASLVAKMRLQCGTKIEF
jgi:hypothetical protein